MSHLLWTREHGSVEFSALSGAGLLALSGYNNGPWNSPGPSLQGPCIRIDYALGTGWEVCWGVQKTSYAELPVFRI